MSDQISAHGTDKHGRVVSAEGVHYTDSHPDGLGYWEALIERDAANGVEGLGYFILSSCTEAVARHVIQGAVMREVSE